MSGETFRVTKILSVNPYQIIKLLEEKLRWNDSRLVSLKKIALEGDLVNGQIEQQIGRIEMLEELIQEFNEALGE